MSPSFSAVLLAGGKSSRMGCDKAFVKIDGLPLWRRQLRVLKELQPREVFIAGPRLIEWENAGGEIIPDVLPDAGPISGLIAALRRSSSPLLLVLAVDLPNMTADYLRGLLSCCLDQKGVIPCHGDRFEPLAAVYPATALLLAESALQARNFSLQQFATRSVSEGLAREKRITSPEEALFLNMNTPEDLGRRVSLRT